MTHTPLPIRQQARERANGRCEYCRLPDQYSSAPFHIDHIIPIKRHGGSDSLANMAWACPHCNRTKETDVGGYDDTYRLVDPAIQSTYSPMERTLLYG